MGIQGLLPLLKECHKHTHVKEYRGQTLAIDAYVWLHRGAYGCAQEIATGVQTVKYVKYAMHRIRLLKHYGVTPYVVFDGGHLPSKMGTENDRESRRTEALMKANALAADGKHAQAREYYVKAVDVTPQMAYQLIKALIAENVSYVVAPYEADAQLAYLEKKGIVDGIITEDSDLLVFGCKKVLFKMDSEGACVEIKRDHFTMCKEFSFSGWSNAEFRQMAILSGCDYLDNIQGLGIKTSHRLMRKYKTGEKVIRYLRLDGQYKIPRNYSEEYKRAEMTFVHQRVFCPEERKLVHLEPLPNHLADSAEILEELRFVGPDLEPEIALGIARGDLCPISKAKMVDIAPNIDVLSAAPAALRGTSSTEKSIKDYFKPAPPAQKAKKRPALRDVTANNLFSFKKEPPTAPGPPVQSRFFAPGASGSKSKKAEVVVIDEDIMEAGPSRICKADSQSTEEEMEESMVDNSLEVDQEEMQEDAEVYKLAEALTQAAEAMLEDMGDGAMLPDSFGDNDLAMPAVDSRALTIEEPLRSPSPAPYYPPKLASTPPRPSTSRQPLSAASFSHISSPTNTGRRSGSKRKQLDDSGFGEEWENRSDEAPLISSPGFMLLEASIQVKAEGNSPRPSSSDNPIDLSDLSSPDARPSKVSSRIAVKVEPIRSPARKAIKRKRSDTIEEAWTSDPVAPEDPDFQPSTSKGKAILKRDDEHQDLARMPSTAIRNSGSQLQRRNGTIPKSKRTSKVAPAAAREGSIDIGEDVPDPAGRKSKKTSSSTSFVLPSQQKRQPSAQASPQRSRSTSPIQAVETDEVPLRKLSRQRLQSPAVDGQASAREKPTSVLSASTYRALDAFRFRPSPSQMSSSLSSSSSSS